MPKKIFTVVRLPKELPDRCEDCPLLGIIPDNERSPDKEDRFKSLVCLGTNKALTKKFAAKRASQCDSHHPHKRPCESENRWERWNGQKPVRTVDLQRYRDPWLEQQQMTIDFKWKDK